MAYKIATVREALSLYKNVTDGTDLDKLITLAEVNLPNSMLKIKDDWEIEYLPEQCVALEALEVDSKEYPLDLSTASIGVMDGIVSTGSPTSVTERITLNNSSESGPLYSNTVEYGEEIVNGTSISVSYTSTTTLSISQSTTLTYPTCTAIATLNGKELTSGISLGYKVYLNGSVWNYGVSKTVSSNATIKLEISSIDIHGNSYGELNGQLRVWHECNTNKTYTTINSSIVYTVSDSTGSGVSVFGYDDTGSLPDTYNTKITNLSLATNGTVDIHVAKVSGSTFDANHKYWKIALCNIIPNYDPSTLRYGIKSIGIKNVLELDSAFKYTNTVNSTFDGSAYGLHSNDSNLIKGIVTSYGMGVCAVTGSISSYSFSDAYTAYRSDLANLGLFLKLDDPGNITPDKYPAGICEMHILLWFLPHQETSVERIFSLYVTLYYDPQIIGTSLSDITLTYTTTDNTKLSVSNSNVANLTASNHTYSSGVGTMSWTTAPTSIINNSDFKDKTTLKTVELPKKVTSIGSSSFSGCTNLLNVSWSSNMTNIGERAFEKTQITTATLRGYWGPTIGNYAFANSGLRVLKIIPDQDLCTFGEGCFSECSKLSTVLWGTTTDTITSKLPTKIFYKTPLLTSVVLHEELSEIGLSAFEESGILSILIPVKTEVIKDKAFKNSKLNTLSFITGNLKTIGTEAFYLCLIAKSNGYTSRLYLPGTITSIGQRAFSGNVFKLLAIPSNLTTLGGNAFSSCLKLTGIYWYATNCNNFSYTSNHPFSKSPISSIIFGTNVEKIPNGIMYNFITLTTTPSLPNSLKTIGTEAFSGCIGLTTSVNIPTNVSTMGTKVFYGCSNLLGASINTTQLLLLPELTFENCINMQSVVFSKTSNINTIGRRAFYNCSDLSTVLFSQSVHTIETEAFKDCYSLTFKTGSYNDTNYNAGNYIFDSVKIIKNKALHNTKWYNNHAATNDGWALMWVNNVFYRMTAKGVASALNAISVDLSRATCVTDDAFGYWDGTFGGGFGYVKGLTLPGNNCLYIGTRAFMGIERVNKSGTYNPSSLQYLGASAFEGTQFFSKFIAPASLTYVGSDVFRNCKKQLTGLDFRNYTGTTIPAGLCDGCSKLDIDEEFWPSTVTIIGDRAFQGIDSMYWDSLPITIEKIGNRAFHNISHSMESLPSGWANNLTSIGYDAFSGITLDIGSVDAPKLLSIGENAFRGTKIRSFKPKRATGTERVSIGSHAFYNCDYLTKVWIPKNCSIGEYAFNHCKDLTTVYFEGTYTEWTTLKNKTTGSKPLFDAAIYYNQTW